MRKQSLNSSLNELPRDIETRPEEPLKYRLKPDHFEFSSPYIEHWVLQLYGVNPARIDNPDLLKEILQSAVDELDLTSVGWHSHHFGPGVSTVAILSESHLSAHTWPELGYVHLDIVTCVEKLTGDSLQSVFESAFQPDRTHLTRLEY